MNISEMIHRATSPKPTSEAVTDSRNALKDTGFFTSKRFLVMIAFLCGLWMLHAVLSGEVIRLAAYVVMVYIACDTVSKSVIAVCNAWIKTHEVDADIQYEGMRHPETGKLPSDPK